MANATNSIKIDGSKKGWPSRLDGVELAFPTIGATDDTEAVSELTAMASKPGAVVAFLASSIEKLQAYELRRYLNGKDVPKGTSREDRKKAPQRSATITAEALQEWASNWRLTPPRQRGASKLRAAEATARREAARADAATEKLLEMIRKLPKNAQSAQLEELISAGVIPADTTL